MTFDHSKPTLEMMLRPGRKSHELHRSITLEIHRLSDREERLNDIAASTKSRFVRDLARDAVERIAERRDALLSGRLRRVGSPKGSRGSYKGL